MILSRGGPGGPGGGGGGGGGGVGGARRGGWGGGGGAARPAAAPLIPGGGSAAPAAPRLRPFRSGPVRNGSDRTRSKRARWTSTAGEEEAGGVQGQEIRTVSLPRWGRSPCSSCPSRNSHRLPCRRSLPPDIARLPPSPRCSDPGSPDSRCLQATNGERRPPRSMAPIPGKPRGAGGRPESTASPTVPEEEASPPGGAPSSPGTPASPLPPMLESNRALRASHDGGAGPRRPLLRGRPPAPGAAAGAARRAARVPGSAAAAGTVPAPPG